MKNGVYLTGHSKKTFAEYLKSKSEPLCCYLCKRNKKDKSVFFGKDGEVGTGLAQIKLFWVEVGSSEATFYALLCQECDILLEGYANKVLSKNEGAREFLMPSVN